MPDISIGQYWRRKNEYGNKRFSGRDLPQCLFIKEISFLCELASGLSERGEHDNVYFVDLEKYFELIEDSVWTFESVSVRHFADKKYVEVINPRYKDGDRELREYVWQK